VDVIGLEDALREVRSVRRAGAQPLDGGGLVTERLQEGERKLGRVERAFREGGNGLLDLNGVHWGFPGPSVFIRPA
jgi:hypothetical protein